MIINVVGVNNHIFNRRVNCSINFLLRKFADEGQVAIYLKVAILHVGMAKSYTF